MDNLTIETPEQIRLELPLAGIGSRFLALALDTLIQFAVTVVFGMVAIMVISAAFVATNNAGPWVMALFILAYFLLQIGYFAVFEAVWNGQTPGKRWMHLRVIDDSGRPITPYASVARNLLRIVDSLPGVYAVGILSALISSKNKRLGDFVAGTVVVHERPLEEHSATDWQAVPARPVPPPAFTSGSVLGLNLNAPRPAPVEPLKVPSGYNASLLSPAEFELIETFLLRRSQLEINVRAQMARQITDKIAPRLNVRSEDMTRAEILLEKLATEYREQARYK